MLNLLLVDDEPLVLQTLHNAVDWTGFGIKIVGEARDGEEAYELCQTLKPDILLTDIRMPKMDGLELALKLTEEGSKIKTIIISGVQDFNYAKTAMELKADGYILKPIQIEELKAALQKVINNITIERDKENILNDLRRRINDSLPALRDKFLASLIQGHLLSPVAIDERLKYYNIPFPADGLTVIAALEIDNFQKLNTELSIKDMQLTVFAIDNVIRELVEINQAGLFLILQENSFAIIFHEKCIEDNRVLTICDEIIETLGNYLNISVSIGIGSVAEDITELKKSYNDALKALQYKFYTGKRSVIDISDIEDSGANEEPDIDFNNWQEPLSLSIQAGNVDTVNEILTQVFDTLNRNNTISVSEVKAFYSEFLRSFCKQLKNTPLANDPAYQLSYLLEKILQQETIQDLSNYVRELFLGITKFFGDKQLLKNSHIVKKVISYIAGHYMEEGLNVKQLSEEVAFLTPNYLSRVFKQITGQTLIEYITNTRINIAKELLQQPDLKIYEICEMVGYSNPKYFTKVFKKTTGIFPTQYREI